MQTRMEALNSMGQFLSGFRVILSRTERAVADWAMVDDYQAVLDLSCARGHLLSHYLSAYQLRGCGLCYDNGDAQNLREGLNRAEIMYTMGADIPWKESSFDRVLMAAPVPGYVAMQDLFHEVLRVLKPGGKFVAAVGALNGNPGLCSFHRHGDLLLSHLKQMEEIGFINVAYNKSRFRSRCLLASKPK